MFKSIFIICLVLLSFNLQARVEESSVTLDTKTGKLEGSLLVPETQKYNTVALIIAGSGATDRNGNNSGLVNNSLRLLAEGLAEHGIASIRYDKRGVGASKSAAVAEVDLRFEHYIDDAEQWLVHINETLDTEQVVVIGHSQGALIGSVIANHDSVDKFISIAGAGQPVHEIIRSQLKGQPAPVAKIANTIMDSLLQNKPVDDVPSYLNALFRRSVQPYLMSWFKYLPQTEVAKLNKPVLIVQGTTDIQVSTEQAGLLSSANPGAKQVLIEGMNHVLKSAPMDRVQNMQTYNMPDLPLKDGLMDNVVAFIKAK